MLVRCKGMLCWLGPTGYAGKLLEKAGQVHLTALCSLCTSPVKHKALLCTGLPRLAKSDMITLKGRGHACWGQGLYMLLCLLVLALSG
jgi:hypothetical protein